MIPTGLQLSSSATERLFDLLTKGVLGTLLLFALFPIYWMVISSFRTRTEITAADPQLLPFELAEIPAIVQDPVLLAEILHYENYVTMWGRFPVLDYFINSLIIASTTTVFALIVGCLGGYAFSKYRFPGKGAVGGALLGTQMIPGILILIPMFLLFVWIQDTFAIPLVDTYHGIIFVYTTFTIPVAIWMLRGFFDTIPDSVEEAARVDGCSRIQALVRVVLPMAAPGIAATGMFVFLVAFNEVLFASILASGDVTPFAIGIQSFETQTTAYWGEMMAASTVATAPVLLLFVLFQKPIVEGLTEGSVKQ
ncbi:carbohydrate ABC transporter permease [Natrarchaeobius halalkaliphilus]|uniref:Carbohydrate ABC transporter permease n=1 Tax=Natrarchaeobius halalkaliphilus TaxID=1679091 RepID=A0A3N6LXB4_9EURY|nr:carbohydrate ABC transporter permease [Natrarchaeobius halalkaliphilus]RQG86671.1 carbohydrate ABC transporter permease [Natrarchaeobius halalkaliphilus]